MLGCCFISRKRGIFQVHIYSHHSSRYFRKNLFEIFYFYREFSGSEYTAVWTRPNATGFLKPIDIRSTDRTLTCPLHGGVWVVIALSDGRSGLTGCLSRSEGAYIYAPDTAKFDAERMVAKMRQRAINGLDRLCQKIPQITSGTYCFTVQSKFAVVHLSTAHTPA